MYMKPKHDKIKWDEILKKLPYAFSYAIFISEQDSKARFVVALATFIIFVVHTLIFNRTYNLQSIQKKRKNIDLVQGYLLLAILVYLSMYDAFYFILSLISIIILLYKIFEFLGDGMESFLHLKVKMPLAFAVYIKFCVWLLGFFLFIGSFLSLVIHFVNTSPDNIISLMLIKSPSNVLTYIGIIILSLIIAAFIIDFLIKMVFKPVNFKALSRVEVQQLFLKIALIIIFADIAYALMYLTFSGIKIQVVNSFTDYLLLLIDYVKSFYYAFCLHFSIPMPTTYFIEEMNKSVKQSSSLQMIQFFHFCLNKIVEITILAYLAGIILSALGLKKEENK